MDIRSLFFPLPLVERVARLRKRSCRDERGLYHDIDRVRTPPVLLSTSLFRIKSETLTFQGHRVRRKSLLSAC